jgi:hypothetical protein
MGRSAGEANFEKWFRTNYAKSNNWELLPGHYKIDPSAHLGKPEDDEYHFSDESPYKEGNKFADSVGYDTTNKKLLLLEFKHGNGSGPDGLLQILEYWFMLKAEDPGLEVLLRKLEELTKKKIDPSCKVVLYLVLAGHIPNLLRKRAELFNAMLDDLDKTRLEFRILRFRHNFKHGAVPELVPDIESYWNLG